ncbi:hypothetical protein LDENG_00218860 [Lucifuga dentata]|nr:hypothetical protein LDENG_00218860 [Lucifuga dentata]
MDTLSLIQVLLYASFFCAAAKEFLQSPSRPRCVFIAYSNVSCYWTPGNNSPPNTLYTLEANITKRGPTCESVGMHAFSCTRIAETHCLGSMGSPNRRYSVRVVAHSDSNTASSPPLCINALDAVKLRRPLLSDLRPVKENTTCLELQWHKPGKFALTHDHICSGSVKYQLQYRTDDQPEAQTVEAYISEHLKTLECKNSLKTKHTVQLRGLCSFIPFTQYTIRLRHRYHGEWSEWSNQLQSCTGIAAPLAPPQLWRTLNRTDDPQQRRVTLLWKSPPKSQTACTSLWFNVSCHSEGSHNALLQTESCLNMTDTSCQLTLPTGHSSCSLTMSNSAGTSPAVWVTLPAPTHTHTVLRVMNAINAKTLNDSSLEITWGANEHPSLTSFLVAWESASESDTNIPNWERLSYNTSSMIITGLQPEVRYTMTVSPEFGSESDESISTRTYTRQGVPSTGPILHVQEQRGNAVLLVWEPPPVEQQRGFITQYSLYCQREDNTQCEVHTVPGEELHYRLTGLSGVYKMNMTAHTMAGEGPAGPLLFITVEDDYSVRTILFFVLPAVFIVVLILIIAACSQR